MTTEKRKEQINLAVKRFYRKHKEEWLTNKKHWYDSYREKLFNQIGSKCVICGSQKRLSFHEIHGKRHNLLNTKKGFEYVLTHKEDFIVLCSFHHMFVHQFAKCWEWNKFKELIEKLRE